MIKKIEIIFSMFLIIFSNFAFAKDTQYVWNEIADTIQTSNDSDFMKLESESAILIEQTTGKVLYEKNSHEKLRPASVTKVMSILLIMEAIDSGALSYTDTVTCSEKAASMGGSQIWFEPGEQLPVEEVLKAICVVSANDCVVAMAEHLEGSEEAFVEKMNKRAKELGMNDTEFKNCHGIDEEGHVTSSYDIALMSRELLEKHPDITKFTTIWMDSLREGKSELTNTNKLVRTYEGCTGLKTGSTSLALYNLSASATRNNLKLIAVIMKAPTTKLRFGEAKKLLDFGFNNYEYVDMGKKNDVIQNVEIEKSTENSVNLVYENDFGAFIKKGRSKDVVQEISINENISAPINKGDVLGKVEIKLDDEIVAEVNLISDKNVSKRDLGNMFSYLTEKWFYLLRK